MKTILTLLQNSQTEQLPVTIYFRSGSCKGIVTRIDEETVELRNEKQRICILLVHIDAVVVE